MDILVICSYHNKLYFNTYEYTFLTKSKHGLNENFSRQVFKLLNLPAIRIQRGFLLHIPSSLAVAATHHFRLVSSPSLLPIVVSRAHRRCSQSSQASLAHHRSSHRRLVAHHLSKKVRVAMMMMMNNNGQTRQRW
ncbi:uncharacterized protein LOC107463339 [Arachis duranensis]|uniref:Uncharacterized protein LOC107463339 n=1 Tax=Arachis duranensis TaxID=130453 RepID=A0A9C6WBV3_ARADU|nr:uncharacterized protein LOC107463339 [Arachis duranensis]